jgi:arylsulfatase A
LPAKFGFQETCLWQHTRRPPRYANPGLEINGAAKDYKDGEYGPDLVNDFALDFIDRHKDRPFLLYYPMILTHVPYQATPASPDWDPKQRGEKAGQHKRHFGEMVEYMDKLIGKVVSRVDSLGLRERTLILFLGDNGTGKGTVSRLGGDEIVGGKGTTTRAGMHVPLIANWSGKIAPRVVDNLIDSTDFLPTMLAVAGIKPSADLTLDGRSFLPQLLGETARPREWIYSWYSPRQGQDRRVREFAFNHRYKLYRSGEFYDLRMDASEKRSLPVDELAGEAAGAAKMLQAVLTRFDNARPPNLEP